MRTLTTTLAAATMLLLATPSLAQRAPDRQESRQDNRRADDRRTETRRADAGPAQRNVRNQPQRTARNQRPSEHQANCMRRYSSYDKRTDTFAPGRGKPRQRCRF